MQEVVFLLIVVKLFLVTIMTHDIEYCTQLNVLIIISVLIGVHILFRGSVYIRFAFLGIYTVFLKK